MRLPSWRLLVLALAGAFLALFALIGLERPFGTKAAASEPVPLNLPIPGEFPRTGLEWTYEVRHAGIPEPAALSATVSYRLGSSDRLGRLWESLYFHGGRLPQEASTERIESDGIIAFHPPRSRGFRMLEWAPFPVARPGHVGTREGSLRLGRGWEPHVGTVIPHTYRDVGYRPVEVPAGRFDRAWYVHGSTPEWEGHFWWVARVGWARMAFLAKDGREIELSLVGVVDAGPGE
jgi:hypothetical protein